MKYKLFKQIISSMLIRLISISFIFLLVTSSINGQESEEKKYIGIGDSKVNIMYVGVDNPLEITIRGYNPEEIEVTLRGHKRSSIRRENGKYIVRPTRPGNPIVRVYANGEEIEQKEFINKNVPKPDAWLAGKQNGTISKEKILDNPRLEAYIRFFLLDVQFTITEFTLCYVHDEIFKETHTYSDSLSEEQLNQISILDAGDKIFFTDIKCNTNGYPTGILHSLDFTID